MSTTGGDNLGLHIKSLFDAIVAGTPQPWVAADLTLFKKAEGNAILGALQEVAASYSATDIDGIKYVVLNTAGGDRTFNLPTLADNISRIFFVANVSGTNDLIIHPEGAEKINDYNENFTITEDWGWAIVIGTAAQWILLTNGWSSIEEVSSETADTGLTLDYTWDDVTGMSLTLPAAGVGMCFSKGDQRIEDLSIPKTFLFNFGLGTVAGNNAPNIRQTAPYLQLNSAVQLGMEIRQIIPEFKLIATGQTILMKARVYSDELNLTEHRMYGGTNNPMYIRWRRIK